MPEISRLSTNQADFQAELAARMDWDDGSGARVAATVESILAAVHRDGDRAVLEYTASLDRFEANRVTDLEVPSERLARAFQALDSESAAALTAAADRIRHYHEQQRAESWVYTESDGTRLGQQVTALQRVGVYVPGGTAAYPSSVLMNTIPARVAGVDEVIMVAPAPDGRISEWVLAAAHSAGVDRVFLIGGAQAVAALAYGTETLPAVDKIVGPGNAYVAEAKRRVFGRVGIDMVAGPSEIMVVCDGDTDPDWVAMDLFSQAEHDVDARATLVSPDAAHLDAVVVAMDRLLPGLERAETIRASLARRGMLIEVRDLDEAVTQANQVAPEHLELSVAEPRAMAGRIRNAGAIFLGRHTAEAFGDYCAGPNHVLPTSRSARFASPLGVYDFQKRTSLIECSPAGADGLAHIAGPLARAEGLTAHARSAEYRLDESAQADRG